MLAALAAACLSCGQPPAEIAEPEPIAVAEPEAPAAKPEAKKPVRKKKISFV